MDFLISPFLQNGTKVNLECTPTLTFRDLERKSFSLKRKVTEEFQRSLSLDNNVIISLQRIKERPRARMNTQVSWDPSTLTQLCSAPRISLCSREIKPGRLVVGGEVGS